MPAKKQQRAHDKLFTREGLPRDGRTWTVADWATLHFHMQAAIAEIANRHKVESERGAAK